MKAFSNGTFGKVHVLRLDSGDFLLESIEEFVKTQGIKNAVVLSGIGTLDYCTIYMVLTTDFPVEKHFAKWENKPLELVSVDGVIADGHIHLHAVVSDCKGAYAGHLEQGCRISYLGEIVIAEMDGFNFERRLNEQGTNLLEDKS
ncbi:MAG: DNA-binding protein [Oscillospiraceae bacterium]|nr:DNA-binding protein [Oscillospiraceae bacterium]